MNQVNVESLEDLPKESIQLPLEVEPRYNVSVCTVCCTGVAFDWILRHLKSKHGQIRTVMEHLSIDAPTLSSTEIWAWISEV